MAYKDPEKRRAASHSYYLANKDQIKENKAKNRAANLDKYRETSHRYYLANKETIAAARRADRETNPDKFRERGKKYREENPEKVRDGIKKCREAKPEKYLETDRKYRETHAKEISERGRKWIMENPEKVRESYVLRKYKMNKETHIALLESQNYLCAMHALCEQSVDYYSPIDHDHTVEQPNNVRGVLCRRCNTLLGTCGDTIEGLKHAFTTANKYLEAFQKLLLEKKVL